MGAGAAEIFSGPDAGLGLLESGGEIAARSPLQLFWRRIRRDRVAQAAGVFILLLIFVAIFAPLVVKLLGLPSPYTQNPNLTGSFGEPLGPSSGHPFGVDPLGEDVASRVIYGTRVSLEIGLIGTAVATTIGVVLGLVAGYYRGWIDTVISFLINVTLSLPLLLLGLIQPGVGVIVFLIAFGTWSYFARIVRGLVLSLREREFVDAARALGASDLRIMFREILPNLVAPIIVYATLQIPLNILIEAALSFLGVGVRPPTASWGQMIAAATPTFNTAWWYMVFPGAALLLTVLAFNLLGDGLRDALNPRTSQ